jgi:putative ABC transport system substrate-binding protein
VIGRRWRWRGLVGSLALAVGAMLAGEPLARTRDGPLRIGALTESWGPTPAMVGLREGLIELGYRENRDFVIGVRFTGGDLAELPEAARQLVESGADILVTAAGAVNAAKAAQAATDRIPIIFIGGSDPVGMGLVQSLARPGGNVTGIADLDLELALKRLELFRELVPGLGRILYPYDAAEPYALSQLDQQRAAARRLGLALIERPVRSLEEARAALAAVRRSDADGILSPRLLSLNIPGFILDAAARQKMPTMFHNSFYVERGGLASYAANSEELGRQAARLVDRIIRGARPADLPVQQATRFELVINRETATALKLSIPPALMLRVDRVVP